MQRANAPRPAPLHINWINNRQEEIFNGRFAELDLGCRQIVGNLNPNNITTLDEIGKGNSGTVTKVKHEPSGKIYARKVIRVEVNAAERNRIMQELEVLKDCNSEYIVRYNGACHYHGEINLFMEYMDGRSLDYILKQTCSRGTRIPEEILGKITVSVIKGLSYLRDNLNIMHRDIKPSNILVNSEGKIKICDFGVSGHLKESIAQSFVGTRQYMAPERIIGQPYTIASDIWSLGITLAELALRIHPIPQHDPMKMYEGESSPEAFRLAIFDHMECIVNQPPPTVPGPPIFSASFKDFVDRCLKKLPQERFDLRTIAQHEFVVRSEKSHVDVASWVKQVLD